MGTLTKHATVAASPDAVYKVVADLHNAPNYIVAIRQITSGPRGAPAVGQRFGAAATFLGQPTNLTLRLATLEPGKRVVIALEGDPAGTMTLDLAPAHGGGSTHVSVTLDVPAVVGLLLAAMMGGMLDESLVRLAQAVR